MPPPSIRKTVTLHDVTVESTRVTHTMTFDRGAPGVCKVGPHRTLKKKDESIWNNSSNHPRVVLTGGPALEFVYDVA